jgi:hypothetical protein
MRALLVAAAAAAALWSLPAAAGHWAVWPSFTFGYGWAPYPYYAHGPRVGFGIHVAPNAYPAPHAPPPSPTRQGAVKLYVYPAAGQSEAQTADDRYQCHVWGAGQSGHDPTLGAGSRDEAEGYARAFTACMEGRGYVVR